MKKYTSFPLPKSYWIVPPAWQRLWLPAQEYMGWARHRGFFGMLAYAVKFHVLQIFDRNPGMNDQEVKEIALDLDRRLSELDRKHGAAHA